ncbi:MAG TPA: hypothetical protein VER76_11855, partial [Pyrinomonadaceae bacterium]|nr:hypothetical protein [Pyrinomonadaceae bacterium]
AGVFAAEIRAALGIAPDLHTTANTNRDNSTTASAAVVLPDFESSQTLIRENVIATDAPRAVVETAQQKTAPQAANNNTAAVQQQTAAQTPQPMSHTTRQTPHAPAPVYTQAQPQRSPAKWIAGGVLVLLLFGMVGAGGWFAWSRLRARSENREVVSGGISSGETAPARAELLDYWLEAFEDAEQFTGQRVAAKVLSLRSGQQFKFHFIPRERGFLYLVGPGAGNAPTTFLTARPAGIMKTNQAAAGADFVFPYGEGQVLELDKNPGTEEYVVIFSRTPLLEPAFLAASAGHELTPVELKELEDLRTRAKTAAPVADVKESGAMSAAQAVTVSVSTAEGASSELVIFDIRIEHR